MVWKIILFHLISLILGIASLKAIESGDRFDGVLSWLAIIVWFIYLIVSKPFASCDKTTLWITSIICGVLELIIILPYLKDKEDKE